MRRSSTACSRIRSSGGEIVSSVFFFASRAKTGVARASAQPVPSCKSPRRPEILYMAHSFPQFTRKRAVAPSGSRSGADLPAGLAGKSLEEINVVGAFRRLAHPPVDQFGVMADQDAPAVGLDA